MGTFETLLSLTHVDYKPFIHLKFILPFSYLVFLARKLLPDFGRLTIQVGFHFRDALLQTTGLREPLLLMFLLLFVRLTQILKFLTQAFLFEMLSLLSFCELCIKLSVQLMLQLLEKLKLLRILFFELFFKLLLLLCKTINDLLFKFGNLIEIVDFALLERINNLLNGCIFALHLSISLQ